MQEYVIIPNVMKVISRSGSGMKVEDVSGAQYNYSGKIVDEVVSNTIVAEHEKISANDLIERLITMGDNMIANVTWRKKDKSVTSRAITQCNVNRQGYISAQDISKKFAGKNAFINIDTRNLVSAVIDKIEYTVK